MAFSMRVALGIMGVLGLGLGAACDGMVGVEDRAISLAPAEAAPLDNGARFAGSLGGYASDAAPLDNGACMSNADCPSDYPNCCQVGGYASCFEESCEDVGGTPKSTLATLATRR
jgi:hypothetical protein